MLRRLQTSAVPGWHQTGGGMLRLVSVLPSDGPCSKQRLLAALRLGLCARCAAGWASPSLLGRCGDVFLGGVCVHAWSSSNNNFLKKGNSISKLNVIVSIWFKPSRKEMLNAKQVLLYQLCPLGAGRGSPRRWMGRSQSVPALPGAGDAAGLAAWERLRCPLTPPPAAPPPPSSGHAPAPELHHLLQLVGKWRSVERGEEAPCDTGTKKAGSFMFGQD